MEHASLTIGDVSRQMLFNFTRKRRENGSTMWDLRPDADWQHRLVMETYQNPMPSEENYTAIFRILMEIHIADNQQEAMEFLEQIEPYEDVSDLTAWLNASKQHVRYLDAVLTEEEPGDAIRALATAHQRYLQDLGTKLIRRLHTYVQQDAVPVPTI